MQSRGFSRECRAGPSYCPPKGKGNLLFAGEHSRLHFYLQKGRAKLTVVSAAGKEATITLLSAGNFVGEESIAGAMGLRLAIATAITSCIALKIERVEMIRVMHEEHAFSDLFLKFLLARRVRAQADLVDQLFNSSEKRLARILLLMASTAFVSSASSNTMVASRCTNRCST
ncbi:MAG: Crp/Fnr family transcriptional regulator [Silvibacterium sp.]